MPVTVTMSEQQLLDAILELAAPLGFLSMHIRPARTTHGWRTPIAGDGKGYPDLTLLHPKRRVLHIAELKSARGRLALEQLGWLTAWDDFSTCCFDRVRVHLWTPSDWLSGGIEEALRA